MVNFVEKRRWFFLASGILAALAAAALIVSTILSGLPLQMASAHADGLRTAGVTVGLAAVLILGYVWWAFQGIPGALKCSAYAVAILAHNLLVLFGFYALMGLLAGWQADSFFVVALLAVVGLSLQSLIASLSRVRENVARHREEPRDLAANRAIAETLNPSLTARLCALLFLVPLVLLAGAGIQSLAAALLVGLICETCTGVFVAALLTTI